MYKTQYRQYKGKLQQSLCNIGHRYIHARVLACLAGKTVVDMSKPN